MGPCQREGVQLYRASHLLLGLLLGFSNPIYTSGIAIELRQAGLERRQGTFGYERSWQLEAAPVVLCLTISGLVIVYDKGQLLTSSVIAKKLFRFDVGHTVDRGWGDRLGRRKTNRRHA